jgi:hypothetical protein
MMDHPPSGKMGIGFLLHMKKHSKASFPGPQRRGSVRPRKIGGTGRIFCDEAGFTGNNLLDSAQEVFVFAGVAIEGERAAELVEKTLCDFKLQGKELKGSRLLKTDSGRAAITSVIEECAAGTRLVSHLKKFALACKFFEYIFEPALADQNSLFYGTKFHLFISNLLFALLRTRHASAEAIFEEFSRFVREGDQSALERLFPSSGMIVDCTSDPLAAISVFAMINKDVIRKELRSVHADPSIPNWVLDLTGTSLFSVLSYWGEVYDDLDVSCDRSKPIESDIDILKAMVGKRDHVRVRIFEKEKQLTFSLTDLPKLVDSKLHPGVQIADVFASAVSGAFQRSYWGKADPTERGWLAMTHECVLDDNVWPDLENMNLQREVGFVNSLVLHELTDRCVRKKSLFEGMPEFIETAYRLFPRFLKERSGGAVRLRS